MMLNKPSTTTDQLFHVLKHVTSSNESQHVTDIYRISTFFLLIPFIFHKWVENINILKM